LVALGEVRVEIILTCEAGVFVDGAMQGERSAHGHFDSALVEHGKSSGQAETDRANVGVRRVAEARGAAAEDFGAREKLDVDFQADDGLVLREHFGREGGFLWSGFRHNGTKIIASADAAIERLRKLAIVGGDGVAGGHGEICGELIERKPANFTRLARFTVFGAAAGNAAQIGGRDPVLALLRQEMVGDAKKGFYGDSDADFFASFTDGTLVKSFEVFELAADDAPGTGFGRSFAEGEESAAAMVEDEDTYADSGDGDRLNAIMMRWHGLR